jgi:hypothetical protein
MSHSTKGSTVINEQAPVVGWSELEITAAPELAWNVLTAPLEPWSGNATFRGKGARVELALPQP